MTIDSFTKIAKGRCLTTKRAVPIYSFLATAYKGLPIKKWHCDNGREFKNKVLDEFIKLFPESKSVHGAPRTPTSQGVIERLNQTIKNTIRGLMQQDDKKKNLCEYLEIALDIYNNSRNRAHGLTPFQSTGEKPMFHQIDTMDCFFTKKRSPIKCKIVEIKKVESMQTYKVQFL
ncbi:hypothetical protein ACTFIR_005757 [Dictyostelium discoideum]